MHLAMGRPSSLLSASSPSPLSLIPSCSRSSIHSTISHSASFNPWTKLPSNTLRYPSLTLSSSSHSSEIQAPVETIAVPNESECVEIGYISNAHGLQGEVCVKPCTDFPELRFLKPGRRWLRTRMAGKETIQDVELTSGRSHPAQNSWIVHFSGIDTIEKAKQIIGSTLLVRAGDRPSLEEGEFYTPDLVGMKVLLKDTGKLVGTVVDVYDSGANDLLQVMLNSSEKQQNQYSSSEMDPSGSGPLVWVPFVEAIVPHVDVNQREMLITPPKGLLELNLRSDGRSKKERRQLEWKERKKFQQRLNASKKKIKEMGQEHILQGFSCGDKAQKSLLANQLIGINFKLLEQAMLSLGAPDHRWNLNESFDANSSKMVKNVLRISKDCLIGHGNNKELDPNRMQLERGIHLLSKGKFAIILVMEENDQGTGLNRSTIGSAVTDRSSGVLLLRDLLNEEKSPKIEEWRSSVPMIVVAPTYDIHSAQEIFSENDYFGFDGKKVQFLSEEKLPVVSSSLSEDKRHKILLKSPWEMLQSPVGSGGVFSLLLHHNIFKNLNELGVEYVEVCSMNQKSSVAYPLFPGFVDSSEADIGIKLFQDRLDHCNFDIIFSIGTLTKITNQTKFPFCAILKPSSHVENTDGEWVDVGAVSSNSFHFHCSIYSLLDACPSDKICIFHVTD